jgi:hypothetical protein
VWSSLVIGQIVHPNPTITVTHDLLVEDYARKAYPFTITDALTVTGSAWDVEWVQTGLVVDQTITAFKNPAQGDVMAVGQTISVTVSKTITVIHSMAVTGDVIAYKG